MLFHVSLCFALLFLVRTGLERLVQVRSGYAWLGKVRPVRPR
jgi:hypothetical protein